MHKNQTVSVESQFTGKAGQFRVSGFFAVIVLLSWLIVVGCSGGGGASDEGAAAINDGVFVDSPVAGLNYQTETQAGITDENGTFHYMDGETVRFSIGDMVLGEAPAEPLMTPLHLAGEPVSEVDVDHPVVTNMARFIQSLDADANPDNGIRITEDVMREVSGRTIDFHQSVHEFETDAHVTMMFDTLNGLNMPHNGEEWYLRSAEQARAHMSEYMDDWIDGHMGGQPGGNNSGNEGNSGSDGMDPGDGMNAGDGGSNGSDGMHMGIFVDSPVEGLHYATDTQSGITNRDGEFTYMDGETVTFSIGDVVLGEALAESIMTPLHLTGEPLEGVDADNPVLVNMLRFMQSLDADGNPDNGITITEEIRNQVSGRMIDFHQSIRDFEHDVHVQAMFDTMNGLDMPHAGQAWHLKDGDDALAHMIEYMDEHMGAWADASMGDWMNDWMNAHMGFDGSDQDGGSDGNHMTDGIQDDDHFGGSGDGFTGPGDMMGF